MDLLMPDPASVLPINLLDSFRCRVEEALEFVMQMNTEDIVVAVQYWNVYSGRLQDLVNHTAEMAEIEAIEAMALNLEQNDDFFTTDFSPDFFSDSNPFSIGSKSDMIGDDQINGILGDSDENIDFVNELDQSNNNCNSVTEPKFVCNKNEKTVTKDESKSKEKKKKKRIDRSYECPKEECTVKFNTKRNLLRHVRIHKPWKCSECPGRFTEKKSLKIHMRTHTGERPYSCSICKKSFTQSGVLTTHMAIHMNLKSFSCEQCGSVFRQKSHLRLHLQRHAGVRRFSCTQCDYKFLTKGDLERHQKTHSDERPFHCELCGRSYRRLQTLKEHINKHFGNKPYTCKHCHKAFSDMSACYKHIKRHKIKSDCIEKIDSSNVYENTLSNLMNDVEILTERFGQSAAKDLQKKKKFK